MSEATGESVPMIVAAAAAAIGAVIYSLKHVKRSECWGVRCHQQAAGWAPNEGGNAVGSPSPVICQPRPVIAEEKSL